MYRYMASDAVHRKDVMEAEVVMKLCITHWRFWGFVKLSSIGMSTPKRFEMAMTRSDMLR